MENALHPDETSVFLVGPVGPLAMISCEPRQARKGATVAVTSCAGVWLVGFASICIALSLKYPYQTPVNRAFFRFLG